MHNESRGIAPGSATALHAPRGSRVGPLAALAIAVVAARRIPLIAAFAFAVLAACGPRESVPVVGRSGYVRSAADLRIFYRVEGEGGDTVVVVHGGPGAGMEAVRADLAPLAQRHTVVYYDQRGGGRSTLPADTTRLGPEHFVADLEAVRRRFGLDPMNVLAHSFGSLVVAEYARRHPDRLGRVIFLGSTGPRRSTAAQLYRDQFAGADSALLRSMYEPLGELLSGTAKDPVSACQTYHERGAEVAESLGRRGPMPRGSECLMQPDALRYYFRYTAQVGPRLFGDWDYSVGLGSFPGALLVIYGADDADGLGVQAEWLAAVRDARLLAVPGADKAVHVERPDAVFSAIDEFLGGRWPEGALPRPDGSP